MTNLKARITKPPLLHMSKKMMMTTPEEVLNSVTEGINAGDLDSLMTLYEADACFATQPGQLAKSLETICQSLCGFTDMKNRKFDLKVKRVLQASDLALVISEWSFTGTGPDGNPVNIAAKKSTEVLRRQQADGTWRFVIDNPGGQNTNNRQYLCPPTIQNRTQTNTVVY